MEIKRYTKKNKNTFHSEMSQKLGMSFMLKLAGLSQGFMVNWNVIILQVALVA